MSLSASPGRTWDEAASHDALALARRFEAAWRQGERPDLGAFLAQAEGAPGASLALLRVDLNLRWEAGDRGGAAPYRERLSGVAPETLVALIYEEFCLREDDGETPDPARYLRRFPEVADRLRRVLDIHDLVAAGGNLSAGFGAGLGDGAPAVPFPEAGQTIAGFHLVEELGRGAFARVFRAEERQLADRPVALKVSRTGTREPQTLARLQHTHIVPVHSYRTDPATGLHLLCMPYFSRLTLAQLLADPGVRQARGGGEIVAALDKLGEGGPLAFGRSAGRAALLRRSFPLALAWWGARMAEALEHAHDRGVLHRDVKPSNVLITADAMPMLLDFNLARSPFVGGSEAEGVRTEDAGAEPDTPGGTLDYMAPEHLEGLAQGQSDRADARSDVYGLGVLLFEALAGARPFTRPRGAPWTQDFLLRAADLRRAGAPRLRDARPEVPPALAAVVRRCLEPDPVHRYPSAADLAADLQAVADDRPLAFAAEPWPGRSFRWARRHRRALAAFLPLAMGLGWVATLLAREHLARTRLWGEVRQIYAAAAAAEADGHEAQARDGYALAFRLASGQGLSEADSAPPRATPDRARAAPEASLAELRDSALHGYRRAEWTRQIRAHAAALDRAADPLRFRLLDPGADPAALGHALRAALAPFYVFDGPNWPTRPDLAVLDPPARDRLSRQVNELLFLWALVLDRAETTDALIEAWSVCNRAMTFARPAEPWQALRARLSQRLNAWAHHEAPPEGCARDEPSAVGLCEWGLLLDRMGRTAEALAAFRGAARAEPSEPWYHYALGAALEGIPGASSEARGAYEVALALLPRSPWPRHARARLDRARGETALAREDLHRALQDSQSLPDTSRDPALESRLRRELAGQPRESAN